MSWHSETNPVFRSSFSESIFHNKYAHEGAETWEELSYTLAEQVCGGLLSNSEVKEIGRYISLMYFIPGGRYLYYAGRPNKFWNNCYLFKSQEDTREDWADTAWKHTSALMTGGGTGNDYSVYRAKGAPIRKTGGVASGPMSMIEMINEIGRRVMQGGSRRSALYASLNHAHPDIMSFISSKDWDKQVVAGTNGLSIGDLKRADFNYNAPLDMTNISVNYDDAWLEKENRDENDVFKSNVEGALRHGEPGFSFNFGDKKSETLRNACTEVTSSDDSDVCNLGSINFSRIPSLTELRSVVSLATKFLLCGTIRADLPFERIHKTREKNRRLGLGVMGLHEWLIQRGYKYEVVDELKEWLGCYREESDKTSLSASKTLNVSTPVANRAIAPTGTIGIMAGTTTGIEPVFAVAYMRRYLKDGDRWHYQYVIDSAAQEMIDMYGTNPHDIECALDLAGDPERRIKFQADVQDYVDMSISSTINLPEWGSDLNNPDTVEPFAKLLSTYAPRLRGFTAYPDGARGGQPLSRVSYAEAHGKKGIEFEVVAHDICEITNSGGVCGI